MKNTRLALCLLLGTVGPGLVGPRGLAAQLVPLGPETDLLADTFPQTPFLAVQPDGAYLVAWDEGSSTRGIFYRYVGAGETPREEWPETIRFWDRYPLVDAVTAVAKGFDVLWHEEADGRKLNAFYRQHLTLKGVPDGDPVRLGSPLTEWVWHVRGNGLMAGWTLPRKQAIVARRLGSRGELVGPELRLNSRPIDNPQPVVMAVADGGFLAVWFGTVPGPTATAVLRARRFSASGKPLGPDFDINTVPLGVVGPNVHIEHYFEVATAPGGRFAVGWTLKDRIYLRFFNAAGGALGPEVSAVRLSDSFDGLESLAFDDSGNLLLLWRHLGDLRLQLFNPRGTALGPPIGVRSEASGIFDAPWGGRVVWAGNSWLVAWGAAGADSYDFSTILIRRFARRQ